MTSSSWSALLAGCWLAGELSVTKIDERTRGVRGCGRQATYLRSCTDPYGANCTWVMNSAGHDRGDDE